MNEKNSNSVIEFLKANEENIKNCNIRQMIKRGDEPFLIELAIKCGADIHKNSDDIIKSTIERYDSIAVLTILKNAGIKFDTQCVAKIVIELLPNLYSSQLELVTFLIDNGANVKWNDNAIIQTAVKLANNDQKYYDILRKILNAKKD